ncbi:hypothetical protein DYB37_010006 [Aphanomyces astaci]|uniref:HIT domain-containing protein n=2 Tax=Aphanomyces astaci TaxID=112090 RepID=A0A3R7AMA0_APHAT|nr:hypothetical protein DYB37_010006 [Aphanomyces astaci]
MHKSMPPHSSHLATSRDSFPFVMEGDSSYYDDRDDHTSKSSSRVIVINAKELGGDYVRKGVAYSRRGGPTNKVVQCCKFCHIVETCSNEVIYEEEHISVFRPLHPANESHILIVPKHHVRNINYLSSSDLSLLVRMKEVAGFVLSQLGYNVFDSHMHLSFHRPPFNSIDHVHMHAMIQDVKPSSKLSKINFVGSVKYSTGTWWCKSFDYVFTRVAKLRDADDSALSRSRQINRHKRAKSAVVSR